MMDFYNQNTQKQENLISASSAEKKLFQEKFIPMKAVNLTEEKISN